MPVTTLPDCVVTPVTTTTFPLVVARVAPVRKGAVVWLTAVTTFCADSVPEITGTFRMPGGLVAITTSDCPCWKNTPPGCVASALTVEPPVMTETGAVVAPTLVTALPAVVVSVAPANTLPKLGGAAVTALPVCALTLPTTLAKPALASVMQVAARAPDMRANDRAVASSSRARMAGVVPFSLVTIADRRGADCAAAATVSEIRAQRLLTSGEQRDAEQDQPDVSASRDKIADMSDDLVGNWQDRVASPFPTATCATFTSRSPIHADFISDAHTGIV